jgi:hypothetical protein
MSIRLFGVLIAVLFTTTGCYVEDFQERAENSSEAQPPSVSRPNGFECRMTLSKGCFDGHILSETAFFVEGKEFFNADDFASPDRFAELVTLQRDGASLVAGQDFGLKLVSALDRNNFAPGFEYFLKGAGVRRGKVRADGNFAINDLSDGIYDLRVQKSIKFAVVEKLQTRAADETPSQPQPENPEPAEGSTTGDQPAEPATPQVPASDAPVALSKQFCATLYADLQLDIRRGQRSFESFDTYKMYVTDSECGATGAGTTLTF